MGCSNCLLFGLPSIVPRGNPHPTWMLIGEAPGYEEAKRGVPFVGRSGILLSELLKSAGIPESECYITNAVMCHPICNATPTWEMVAECKARLMDEIEATDPPIIVTLGAVATGIFLNVYSVADIRGIPEELEGERIIVPTYHPSFALRNPQAQDWILEDLRIARDPSSVLELHKTHKNTKRYHTSTTDAEEIIRYLSDNNGTIAIYVSHQKDGRHLIGLSAQVATGICVSSDKKSLMDALRGIKWNDVVCETSAPEDANVLNSYGVSLGFSEAMTTSSTNLWRLARRHTGMYMDNPESPVNCARNADLMLGTHLAMKGKRDENRQAT